MKRFIDVHTGEVMAGQGEVVLMSDAKGGAMVLVAYDAAHKIGALAQALFNGYQLRQHNGTHRLRDATLAIDEMIADMALLGADREAIEVSLVVGDRQPTKTVEPDFEKSLNETVELLRQRHVKIHENIVPEDSLAHVSLDVNSGVISYS